MFSIPPAKPGDNLLAPVFRISSAGGGGGPSQAEGSMRVPALASVKTPSGLLAPWLLLISQSPVFQMRKERGGEEAKTLFTLKLDLL